ncbi:ABC transporter permease [Lichenicoccus sp.]|uniref:ABC transporter permease n=1 Tax=Lichenicoccus sp. TaxID=2781899 RepID=UPI003D1007CF
MASASQAVRRQRPRSLLAGSAILVVGIVLAAVPQLLAPLSPLRFDYAHLLSAPSLLHPLGTDEFGRDMLSRVIWGYAVDMQIALFATVPALLVGTVVGALAGYFGGFAETLLVQLVGVVVAFPFLVLVIAIVTVLGPGLVNMYVATALVGWVFYAQLMMVEMKLQRRLDYAAAARAMGYGQVRIIFRHLLPNAVTAVLIYWMTDMALAILLGSSLGYVGLGAQPPVAEWGALIAGGKNYMTTAWWMTVFPGIAIVVTGLGFSLTGDGLGTLLGVRR